MMLSVLRVCAAGALVTAMMACSGSESSSGGSDAGGSDGGGFYIDTTGYDQSCKTNADCVLVMTGEWSVTDACCGRGCAGAAINASAQASYSAALQHAISQCAAQGGCGIECVAVEPYCKAGQCAICQGGSCADAGTGTDGGTSADGGTSSDAGVKDAATD
jgi:hypothetical protein